MTLLYGSIEGRARFEPAWIPATDPADRARGPALVAPPDVIGYEVKRHGLGAAEGLGLGLLTGAVAGAMAGAALGSDTACTGDHCAGIAFSSGDKALMGAAVGGCAGALLGTLIGAIVGHTNRVVF